MQIRTQVRIGSALALATIALIGLMILRATAEVEAAQQQRLHIERVTRALGELRLASVDYILHRPERAREQEALVFARLDALLAARADNSDEAAGLLEGLRQRVLRMHRLFLELRPGDGMAQGDELTRKFEHQLTSRLLIGQQESVTDTMQLTTLAVTRMQGAQAQVFIVIFAGLLLLAAVVGGAIWLIHRNVLGPISRLEQATQDLAQGRWDVKLRTSGNDELSHLAGNFVAMARALRDSFAHVERSNRELAELNKEIESFSYSVSHDLRGPLRSMDGFAQAVLEDYEDKLDAEGQDYLRRIRAASQRMGRLIDELLGLSRVTRTELRLEAVDLSGLARELTAHLGQQHPQRQIRWDIDEDMEVRADRALMRIAMQNLLENAVKFTGKTEDASIRVGRRTVDGQTTFFVADNGVGFDMHYASRLFGAFQRLHHESEFAGTGVGLAIVQRIFLRHGGRIWAQAQPGHGATFFFSMTERDDGRAKQGNPAG